MVQFFLILIVIVCLFVLLFYIVGFFLRLTLFKIKNGSFNKPISIIICAKNELQNLRYNLPKILAQDYPEFEVIVVNDQSNDGSEIFLKDLEKKYNRLVVVTIDKHINQYVGKKFALTLGIKTARYAYLLLTDADCLPKSTRWAQLMCRNFKDSDIVLGYGGYEQNSRVLNEIIRFDTFNVAQQYFSYALAGYTYMGVGRNIAYKKSVFFDNKGFTSHIHLPSGDDDLFIQEVAAKYNVAIEIDPNSQTISKGSESWSQWSYQKRRHLTTAPLYKNKFKILLALYSYCQFLFWLGFFLIFILKGPSLIVFALLVCKIVPSYIINYKSMKRLNALDLYWFHPIYELVHLVLQGFFVLLNLVSEPKKWRK